MFGDKYFWLVLIGIVIGLLGMNRPMSIIRFQKFMGFRGKQQEITESDTASIRMWGGILFGANLILFLQIVGQYT